MMRPDNFIYFLTANGFFIGMIFGILSDIEIEYILFLAIAISGLFYILGMASAGFYIKSVDLKSGHNIRRDEKEYILDMYIARLEKREEYLRDSQNFIINLEEEFAKQEKQDEEMKLDKE